MTVISELESEEKTMQILILIIILIFINAFFAASELALVSIKPLDVHRLKKQGKKNANVLEKVTSDSTRYLSTIQVAITIAGFISSAFAGSRLSGDFVLLFERWNITIPSSVAVIMITLILSFFTLVFGELVPKRIAILNPTKFGLFCAPVILVFMKLFNPFVWLLSISTKGVLKLFGVKSKTIQANITEGQIKEMIVYGQIEGLYKIEERNMMKRIFSLDDLTAKMIMTPKNAIIGIDLSNPDIEPIIKSRYSRIPVFKETKDTILGIIFIKDLLLALREKSIHDIDIKSLIRKPVIINEAMKLNVLLKQMRDTFEHFTFITNDSDEFIGIITLEDILEEIVGNIYDEHDFVGETSETLNEFGYIFEGDMIIRDIEQKLGIKLSVKDSSITIGEFVQNILSTTSKKDQSNRIKIDVGTIKVLSKTNDKVNQIELKLDQNKLNTKY